MGRYPKRTIGPDGRVMVALKPADAIYTVGGMALEFIVRPEIWPAFFDFLCQEQPDFAASDSAAVRGDALRVVAALPPRQAGSIRRES